MIAEEVKPELVKDSRARLLTKMEAVKTRISSAQSLVDEIQKDCEAKINWDILEETLQVCQVSRVGKNGVSRTYEYYRTVYFDREEGKLKQRDWIGNVNYKKEEAAAWREAKARSERLLGISRTMENISKNLQDKIDMLNLEMYLLEEGEPKEDDAK